MRFQDLLVLLLPLACNFNSASLRWNSTSMAWNWRTREKSLSFFLRFVCDDSPPRQRKPVDQVPRHLLLDHPGHTHAWLVHGQPPSSVSSCAHPPPPVRSNFNPNKVYSLIWEHFQDFFRTPCLHRRTALPPLPTFLDFQNRPQPPQTREQTWQKVLVPPKQVQTL